MALPITLPLAPRRRIVVDRINLAGFVLITAATIASLIVGTVVAAVGGTLIPLGDGFGGLYDYPAMALLLAAFLALPAFGVALSGLFDRHKGDMTYAIAFLGPALCFLTYAIVAHFVEPCNLKLWNTQMTFDGTPLCDGFGSETGPHLRFHLLQHAIPTLPVLAFYGTSLRHWLPQTFAVTR